MPPIPRARVSMAAPVNTFSLRSVRQASLNSYAIQSIRPPIRHLESYADSFSSVFDSSNASFQRDAPPTPRRAKARTADRIARKRVENPNKRHLPIAGYTYEQAGLYLMPILMRLI